MINIVTKLDYNLVITSQHIVGCLLSFDPKDAKKVHMINVDNLIVRLNITNYILKHALIDQAIMSLLSINFFQEMGILPSILTPLPLVL